jgi:HSP20 family molecular chaperone IbpA
MTAQVVLQKEVTQKPDAAKVPVERIRVAPNTVAYVESHNLVLEFAIPGAPTETVDIKMLEDGVYLTAPARDIEYAAALPFGWPVKPEKAEASYEHGLLRISVPLKDPMDGAVKVTVTSGTVPAIDGSKK